MHVYVYVYIQWDTFIPCCHCDIALWYLHYLLLLFQLLDNVCYVPAEAAYSDGKKPLNTPKNRYPDIVPCKYTDPQYTVGVLIMILYYSEFEQTKTPTRRQ